MSEDNEYKYILRITAKYKKHLKRVARRNIDDVRKINDIVEKLQKGLNLDEKYRDHALHGDREGERECHVLPDLLLVYRIIGDILVLELVDTGTHSDLFGK